MPGEEASLVQASRMCAAPRLRALHRAPAWCPRAPGVGTCCAGGVLACLHVTVCADVFPWAPLLISVIYSLVCWPSSEGTLSWPDLLSDPSIMGSTLQRLAQGRVGHILGPEDGVSLVSPSSPAKYFSASGEQG